MLYILRGRAGSGKTAIIRNMICELANTGVSRPMLLVPEQFSFETERAMLKLLGARKMKNIDVFSFPRLSFYELKNNGIFNIKTADSGVKAAIMSEALCNLEGRISVFSRLRHNASSLNPLVDFCKELNYCCISEAVLEEKLDLIESAFLKNKLEELNLIRSSYEALLTQSYFDDTQALDVFNSIALKNGYFKNKTLFLDGFRNFSRQELECLEIAFSQCTDVYISICVDESAKMFSSLRYMRDVENMLRTIANKANCSVETIECKQSCEAFSKDIGIFEKFIYSGSEEKYPYNNDIIVASCSDKEEEAKYVACTIKKLLKSGKYRCRDIAIIERTNGTYKNLIVEALKRYNIPVFDDSRQPLENEPLFLSVSAMLECVTDGFTTENIMKYLKTGLTDISLTEISRLEKYALIWGINSKGWQNDFKMHPNGFGDAFDEASQKELQELNSIRKRVIMPLISFKNKASDADGKEITKALYEFIVSANIKERLYELTVELDETGFSVEANHQEQSWNILINILDNIAALTENKYYSLKRWSELFKILVSSGDMGEIPQGLDEVTVGCAGRIRLEKTKVVFLVGVNKDEFPLVNVEDGILTNSDRVLLSNLGIGLRPPFEDTVDEERFITYCALTAASDKLFITYKTSDADGSTAYKSEIIEELEKCFTDFSVISVDLLPFEYFIENEASAFSALVKNYLYNNEIKATLSEYFAGNEEYSGKLKAVEALTGYEPIKFSDRSVSKELFGKNIYISASKVESFYNCPFSYFMRYGLGAEPIQAATLDSAQNGTIIHILMEEVLKKFPKDEFVNASEEEIKNTVFDTLKCYLEEKMGGVEEKSDRFMFLFNRIADAAMAVFDRLKTEFSVGSFSPCDFELKIGGEQIPAYELPLDDGMLKVTGSVDRVDLMEKDGIKYIRVIDYKTGKKEFKLSELFDGLNIQMVLYLMALIKNGTAYYGESVPAGVLYLPSKIGLSSYLTDRFPNIEDIQKQKRKSGKLSGMVLDSPVVFNGMGVDKYPDYFPVSYKKDGSPKDNYYSLSQFKVLSQIIDDKIKGMGEALHNGDIAPIPCGEEGKADGKMCEYCSYRAACGRESGEPVHTITKLTHLQALERLEGDGNEQKMD